MGKKERAVSQSYQKPSNKAKRVCMVRYKYYTDMPPFLRDTETLVSHGYEVDVISANRKGEKSQEVIRGVTVYRLGVQRRRGGLLRYMFEYSTFFLLASWKLIRLHLKRKYDVVEVANLPDFLVFTSVIPKLLGAKVSLYFMELMPEVFADKLKTGPNHIAVKLLRFVEKVSAKWADHVIAANGICQQEILKSRGVPASKMSAVLNVPDEKVFSQRSSNGSDPGRFCITTHSTLLERYGIQVLLRAVPLLTGEIPQLEVMVLGDGEYRHQLEEMAKTLGIADRVRFTGFVPIEELLSVLTRADVGIVSLLPQKQPQMPNKLFEYLALGKPTVATALPAVKPYVNSDSVMYYEPENERDLARCILELYRNPEKRKEQAANGLAAYQKYRWSAMKYEYLKVFDQLTKQHDRIVL